MYCPLPNSYWEKFESESSQFDDAVVGSVELSLWRLKPIVDAVPCSPDVRACRISRWRCSIIAFHWIALHSVAVSSYCNTLAFLMGRNMASVILMLFLCKRIFQSLERPGQSHHLKEHTISPCYWELGLSVHLLEVCIHNISKFWYLGVSLALIKDFTPYLFVNKKEL